MVDIAHRFRAALHVVAGLVLASVGSVVAQFALRTGEVLTIAVAAAFALVLWALGVAVAFEGVAVVFHAVLDERSA